MGYRIPNTAFATWLASLLPTARPHRVAVMTGKAAPKYRDLGRTAPFTLAMLQAHASGRATYAVTLDAGGLARIGVIDCDAGGRAQLHAVLAAAYTAGVTMFAIAVDSPDGHTGGYCFALFDDWYASAHITHHMRQLAHSAGAMDAEVWPCRQVIRLPFGVHQRAHTRGTLMLPSGACFSLDVEAERATAFEVVQALACNRAPPALPPPQPALPLVPLFGGVSIVATSGALSARTAIDRFNAEHSLDSLLDRYGAIKIKDGYSCPCGVPHTHSNTLTISRKTGKLWSHSPHCKLHTEHGWDAFGVYCHFEHNGNRTAALKRINPFPGRRTTSGAQPAPQTLPHAPSDAERKQREHEAERKRVARRNAAAQTRDTIEARANADDTLSDAALMVLLALLHVARERDWCRPSVARLMEMINRSERRIYDALAELTRKAYITNQPEKGKTTRRTFTPLQLPPMQTAAVYTPAAINATAGRAAPVDHEHDHVDTEEKACERAPSPPSSSMPCAVSVHASVPFLGHTCALEAARGAQVRAVLLAAPLVHTPPSAPLADALGPHVPPPTEVNAQHAGSARTTESDDSANARSPRGCITHADSNQAGGSQAHADVLGAYFMFTPPQSGVAASAGELPDDGVVYGPCGGIAYVGGAAYVPATAAHWYAWLTKVSCAVGEPVGLSKPVEPPLPPCASGNALVGAIVTVALAESPPKRRRRRTADSTVPVDPGRLPGRIIAATRKAERLERTGKARDRAQARAIRRGILLLELQRDAAQTAQELRYYTAEACDQWYAAQSDAVVGAFGGCYDQR